MHKKSSGDGATLPWVPKPKPLERVFMKPCTTVILMATAQTPKRANTTGASQFQLRTCDASVHEIVAAPAKLSSVPVGFGVLHVTAPEYAALSDARARRCENTSQKKRSGVCELKPHCTSTTKCRRTKDTFDGRAGGAKN